MHQNKPQRKPSGFVIYKGPSLLNGKPIVAIAIVGKSQNVKTGNMVQTYILADEGLKPTTAARLGQDESVCGDCKQRPSLGGACYVTLFHGPLSVYNAYQRGSYPDLWEGVEESDSVAMAYEDALMELGAGRAVRLGTYGDPAAVPTFVWQSLVALCDGHTGYTHQWNNPDADIQGLRQLVMASCDTEKEAMFANAYGWRHFRTRASLADPLLPGEITCPASAEAGKVRTCATCKACDGATRGTRQASVAIVLHGFRV